MWKALFIALLVTIFECYNVHCFNVTQSTCECERLQNVFVNAKRLQNFYLKCHWIVFVNECVMFNFKCWLFISFVSFDANYCVTNLPGIINNEYNKSTYKNVCIFFATLMGEDAIFTKIYILKVIISMHMLKQYKTKVFRNRNL